MKRFHHVTIFPDEKAGSFKYGSVSLVQLGNLIRATTAIDKSHLPFVKFARFGHKRTEHHCLRNNDNVLTVSGAEGDYDEKQISFAAAIKIARTANLHALFYTTSSYTKDAPAWRIMCPASHDYAPAERLKWIKRINGLYGGKLCAASFTLSQAFYFGGVVGKPKPRVVIVDGDFIDLRADLREVEKAISSPRARTDASKHITYVGFQAHLKRIGVEGYHAPLRDAVASFVATYGEDFDHDKLKARLRAVIGTNHNRKYLRDDRHLDALIDSAIKKFGHRHVEI